MKKLYTYSEEKMEFTDSTEIVIKKENKQLRITFCIGFIIAFCLTLVCQNVIHTKERELDKTEIQKLTAKTFYLDSIRKIDSSELSELKIYKEKQYINKPTKRDIHTFVDTLNTIVPKSLIKTLINAESTYNIHAVSSTGCSGLMQLCKRVRGMYSNHYSVLSLNHWEQNIKIGTLYLEYLYRRFGTWERALNAYNTGYPNGNGYGNRLCSKLGLK